MSGVGVEIRVEGGAAVAQRLKAVAAKLSAPADLYGEIGDALVVSTQNRFETGNTPEGSPWPASIRAMLTGGRTLRDSGRLANSMTREADGSGVAIGTNVIYAAVHQFGAVIRAKNKKYLAFKIGGKTVLKQQVRIPARPFLGLSKADETEIAQISEDFLATGLGVPNA
jgi:phage virion morphogenesis protein